MRALLRPGRLLVITTLTLAWCGLWGEVSFANVVSGLAVTAVVEILGVGNTERGSIRLRPLLHLLWVVTLDLVRSTVSVATEIITPADYTNEAIVAVKITPESKDHLLLLIVAITLTPGTAVVDADDDTLYLYLLHDEHRADTIKHVEQLTRIACDALPTKERTIST